MVLEYEKKEGTKEIKRIIPSIVDGFKEQSRNFTRCGETKTIPVKNIRLNPNQPRKGVDKNNLQDLTISIMEYGLMQPICVRQISPFEYELIAGERRLNACKSLGMAYIPAIVMSVDPVDSAILALVENIQRENLNYLEEAEAYSRIIDEYELTQEELADKIGKSQSNVANKIRILRLSAEIRELLTEHRLTERHARALLRISNEKTQKKAIEVIVEKGLNVAKTEELIDKLIQAKGKKHIEQTVYSRAFGDVRIFNNTLKQAVEMMRRSGIEARANKKESGNYIEYTIIIPKGENNKV